MQKPTSAQAHESFAGFASHVARWTGNHWAFLIAAALVVASLNEIDELHLDEEGRTPDADPSGSRTSQLSR